VLGGDLTAAGLLRELLAPLLALLDLARHVAGRAGLLLPEELALRLPAHQGERAAGEQQQGEQRQ
jgi:hypothetical protein